MARTYSTYDGDTCDLIEANVTVEANVTAEELFPDEDERAAFLADIAAGDGHTTVGGGAAPLILIRENRDDVAIG
jgi:hypothetical protein